MKKLVLLSAIALGAFSFQPANAQVSVSINIGTQPLWGPVGYDYAEYYYMPDIDVYYWVPRRQYVYLDAGRWMFAASLPGRCSNFDLYRGYKVVINDPSPWNRCDYYRDRYSSYRGWSGRQVVIRDSRDNRYWSTPGHPYYRSYDNNRRYDDRYARRDNDRWNDRRDNGRRNDDRRDNDRRDNDRRDNDRSNNDRRDNDRRDNDRWESNRNDRDRGNGNGNSNGRGNGNSRGNGRRGG